MGGATAVIVDVVAVAASIVAGPEVGAAIFEATTGMDAIAAVGTGALTAGEYAATTAAIGGAVMAGSTSALNAAIQGKDINGILAAGAEGAAGGAAGGAIGSEVGAATGSSIAGAGAGGVTSGFTKAELSGSNLSQATKAAEVGGATGALTEALFPSGTTDPTARSIAGTGIGQIASNVINPPSSQTGNVSGGGGAAPTGPTGAPTSVATTGAGTSPGSAALGQALNLGGGDVSPPVNIGGGESSGKTVWNQASLRTPDSTGA